MRRKASLGVLLLLLCALTRVSGAFPGWLQPARRDNPHDPKNPINAKPAAPAPTPTPTAMPCRLLPVPSNVAQANTAFALDLLASLSQSQSPTANITFSPFSVSTALAMAWQGARGETASQMASVLHLQDPPADVADQFLRLQATLATDAGNATFTTADSVWLNDQITFSAPYLALMQRNYLALVTSLSFADPQSVASQINAWVAVQTQNLIPSILEPKDVDPKASAFFLVNAVYFQSAWTNAFKAGDTQPAAPFTCADGSLTYTAMMNQTGYLPYAEDNQVQVLELPYGNGSFSMQVILPKPGTSLASVQAGLSPSKLAGWSRAVCPSSVAVSLPKMQLSFGTLDLEPNLKGLGMIDAFGPAADFSLMASGPHLEIFFVKHKAVVQVDEGGTQAAAVTVVGGGKTAVAPIQIKQPVIFNANHPFLFLIQDHGSGTVLFVGRVQNPDVP